MNPRRTETALANRSPKRIAKSISMIRKRRRPDGGAPILRRNMSITAAAHKLIMHRRKFECFKVVFKVHTSRIEHFNNIHLINNLLEGLQVPGTLAITIKRVGNADHCMLIAQAADRFLGGQSMR